MVAVDGVGLCQACGSNVERNRSNSMKLSAPHVGPFLVDLLSQDEGVDKAGHVTYSVRVRGRNSKHVVHRRYSCFERLRWCLVQLGVDQRALPLPPKSIFRKRLPWVKGAFLANREEGLRQLLRAAVALDPDAEEPMLRKFLGLTAISKELCTCNADQGILTRSWDTDGLKSIDESTDSVSPSAHDFSHQ